MRIWITGSNGFLGSYLWDELEKAGHHIDGNDLRICSSYENKNRQTYGFDCCSQKQMYAYVKKHETEVLIHCAATAHEGLSNFSPSFITKNIYEASVATFSAAIAAGVKRIVFMSSMARYGNGVLPFCESSLPSPIDPYGIAKVAAEQTLDALCRLHNVEYVIAVPHNIIGPRQKYDDPARNVASIMINKALRGEDLIVYGDGNQRRCFSPIADCLDSLIKMVDASISGEIINIGPDGGSITINELAQKIINYTGAPVKITHVDTRPNEVREAWCSSDKARKLLGFAPKQSLDDCLKEMVLYIKENGTKPFNYFFPLEIINEKTPKTWTRRLI